MFGQNSIAYLRRMKEERDALVKRLNQDRFTVDNVELPDDYSRELLRKQVEKMEEYRKILEERIDYEYSRLHPKRVV